jgi:hypothetical protein
MVVFLFPGAFQNLFLFIYGFISAPGSIRDPFYDCYPCTYLLFICNGRLWMPYFILCSQIVMSTVYTYVQRSL